MKSVLDIINPLTFKGWDDLVGASPFRSIFQTSSWAKVLHETYRYTPLYLTVCEQNKLKFTLPLMAVDSFWTGRRGISLPFTDYCEPIVQDRVNPKEILDIVLKHAKDYNWKTIELRGCDNFIINQPKSICYYGHSLNIADDEERIFSSFRSNTRRNIRKAIREDVNVTIDNSIWAMNEFYRLHCMTRKRHGVPPQPRHFFNSIYENIISNHMGSIVLGVFDNKVIATAIYFHFHDQVIYKYGASDMQYQNLRANNLVMWEAIKYYARSGYKTLDFGKTEYGNEGLRNYKLGWGTQERIVSYYKYDAKNACFIQDNYKNNGWFNQVFKRLPVIILKLLGSALYRHIA